MLNWIYAGSFLEVIIANSAYRGLPFLLKREQMDGVSTDVDCIDCCIMALYSDDTCCLSLLYIV